MSLEGQDWFLEMVRACLVIAVVGALMFSMGISTGDEQIDTAGYSGGLCKAVAASEVGMVGTVVDLEPHPFSVRGHLLVLAASEVLWGDNAVGDTLRILWPLEDVVVDTGGLGSSDLPVFNGYLAPSGIRGTRAVWFLSHLSRSMSGMNGCTVGPPLLFSGSTEAYLDEEMSGCPPGARDRLDRLRGEELVGYARSRR